MQNHHNESAGAGDSRRNFLKKAAAATAALAATNPFKTPVYGQTQAPSAGRVIGANDRIVVGYVGVGSQGMAHVRSQKTDAKLNNIVQAAVCDVYQKRLDEAAKFLNLGAGATYKDHRKLLECKDIDAITVATIDNWHADVAIDALNAGKHVYGEKPLARYLREGFEIHDTVKRTGKVFQIGSQFCADPMIHKAAEWIRAGKIGPLVWGQGTYTRNNHPRSEWTYPIDPEANTGNLDWNRWLGKAPQIPFNPEHYFSWHKFYTYNSGILGNLLSHRFLPMMMATGNPQFPRRVVCTGTRKVSTDRETTDTTHLLAEFPSGLTMMVGGSIVNEHGLPDVLRGFKGTLYFSSSQNKVELRPERPFTDEVDPQEFSSAQPVGSLAALEKNFFDCIRSGAAPYGSIDLAVRAHTVLSLAEMSERMSLALLFDEKTRQVTTGNGQPVKWLDYDTTLPL